MYLLERRCLSSASTSTSAESMYGVTRVKTTQLPDRNASKLEPLSSVDTTRLALLLSLGPYLKEKLDRRMRWHSSAVNKSLWSAASSVIELGNMLVKWRFLVGTTYSFDAVSLLLGQVVRRKTLEDDTSHQRQTTHSAASPEHPKKRMVDMESTIAAFLGASVFFSWLTRLRYQISQGRRNIETTSPSSRSSRFQIMLPPPGLRNVETSPGDKCPICQQPRKQPVACPSGYVFCSACLLSYLEKHGKCPVTGVRCNEANVVPVYESFD